MGPAACRRRLGQCVELEYLAVLPQAQHRQVALALVQALRTAKQATVVAATDDAAIGFYRAPRLSGFPGTAGSALACSHPLLVHADAPGRPASAARRRSGGPVS